MDGRCMTQTELAERWQISEATLERWRTEAGGPVFIKLGNQVRYRIQDVEAFEAEVLRASTKSDGGIAQKELIDQPTDRRRRNGNRPVRMITVWLRLSSRQWRSLGTQRQKYPATQFASGFDVELFRFLNWVASQSCSDWATHGFLSEWITPDQMGEMINGWSVLALPDVALDYEEITDPVLKGYGNSRAPLRPMFAPGSPKTSLVCAFETFAEQRRLDYERRNELEDEE